MGIKRIIPRVPWLSSGPDLITALRLAFEGADELLVDPPAELDGEAITQGAAKLVQGLDLPLTFRCRRTQDAWWQRALEAGCARLMLDAGEPCLGFLATLHGGARVSAVLGTQPGDLEQQLWKLRELGVGEVVLPSHWVLDQAPHALAMSLGRVPLNLGLLLQPEEEPRLEDAARLGDGLYFDAPPSTGLWHTNGIKARLQEAGLDVRK